MTFTDPETLPERLLWLRADRDVIGGGVAHWNGTSNTQLRGPVGQGFKTGYVDFGFACWVRINALPPVANLRNTDTHIAGKWTGSTDMSREWLLCLNSPTGADQFCFAAKGPTNASTVVGPRTTFPGGVEIGRWYFVVVWLDTAAKTLNMSVDGVKATPVDYTGSPAPDGSIPFTLGASGSVVGYPAISLSRATFFKQPAGGIGSRIDEIISTLYGGGAGADLSDLGARQAEDWGMLAYWPLDEPSGTRRNRYQGNRERDLEDATGIGSVPGPFPVQANHATIATRWTDQVNNQEFSGTGPIWQGDSARLVSSLRQDRFERTGLSLSGRSKWTAIITAATHMNLGSGLYGESSGSGDDDYLELRMSHDGVPELAVKPPGGPEVVARASETLGGRRPATIVSTSPVTTTIDSVPRLLCRVNVGQGHPFATTDLLWVKGLGPPFDGLQIITFATEDEIHFVVDNPETPPATVGARRFSGGSPTTNPQPEYFLQQTLDHRFPAAWSGSQWTVAGWVRKTGESFDQLAGGSGVFAAKDCSDLRPLGSRPQILHGGDGSPGSYRLDLPGGPSASFGAAPRDTWVHLAAVRSGNGIALYYNGSPAGVLDVSSDPGLGSAFTGLSFGSNAEVAAGLPCLLDNWGVWLGRSLSEPEIATLFGNGNGLAFAGLPAGLKTDLAAWYDFDEVSGSAVDASGHGRHLAERGVVPSREGTGGGIPFTSARTEGVVVGSGCVQVADQFRTDAGAAREYQRFVLTVRRDGSEVSFFRNGEPIGSGTLEPALLGPSSGSSRVLGSSARLGSPHGAVEQVLFVGDALDNAKIAGLSARLSVRVNRTNGVGPLAVQFDATQFAGVDRMAAQDHAYLWTFTRADDGSLQDDFISSWSGQAYARSTGFFVSQVFEKEGVYHASLAVLTPPYDRKGQPQPQTCLFAGKVATITVDPWPANTMIYYVSSTHPNRDDQGLGTSPDAPLATFDEAVKRMKRPFTQVLLRSGDEFQLGPRIEVSYTPSPVMIGTYGDPADGKPTLISSAMADYKTHESVRFTGAYDVRVSGVAMQGSGDMDASSPNYAKIAYNSNGRNTHILFSDIDLRGTHRFMTHAASDRAFTVDRSYLGSLGDYTIFSHGCCDFSMTRCAMEGDPQLHFVRYQQSQRTHISHCTREGRYPSGSGRSWVTIRHQSRFTVVTDTIGDLLGATVEPGALHYTGPHWGLFERNKLREIMFEASLYTVRYNEMSILHTHKNITYRDAPANIRGGRSDDGRVYHNQRIPDVAIRHQGVAGFLVNEQNQVLGSTDTLEAPAIELAEAIPGSAILATSGAGVGGPDAWRFRWMRRPSGSDDAFEPLVGQVAAGIVDTPPEPGTYEYRLDMVTDSGIEGIGKEVVTVVIPADQDGPGYRLNGPVPSTGLVNVPSEPFDVLLLAEVPPSGSVTITPISDGPGRFEPPQVVLTDGARSAAFRFIPDPAPGGLGAWLISTTNDAGFTDPAPVTFVATRAVEEPNDPPPVEEPNDPPVEEPNDPPPVEEPPPFRPIPYRPIPDVVPPGGGGGRGLSAPPLKIDPKGATSPLSGNSGRTLSPPPEKDNSNRPPSGTSALSNRSMVPPPRKRGS